MRQEAGFSAIELLVTISITGLLGLIASMSTYQTISIVRQSDDRQVVLSQLESARYWLSRDARMAESIVTSNLSSGELIKINWTEWENVENGWEEAEAVYHSSMYYFDNLSDGAGALKRNYQSSAGVARDTLVAERIQYNPGDADNTSTADYQNGILSVKLRAMSGGIREIRQYLVAHRPGF